MLFEELSNMSPRDLILRTRESLRDTHESLFGNTQFDEFILAVRDDIKKGKITETVLNNKWLEHIAVDQISPSYPFLYACVLNELAQQALDAGNHNQSWPLIAHASASAEGAATHTFYNTVINTTEALNHNRAMAGANARNEKFQMVKDYALTLMTEKRPKHGWNDFMHAAESIKSELVNFIILEKVSLSQDLIVKTLQRWLKKDEHFRSAVTEIIPTFKL